MMNSFNLFGLNIHFYSLCILAGIIVAYFIISKEAKKHNIDSETITNIMFYGLLFGILLLLFTIYNEIYLREKLFKTI